MRKWILKVFFGIDIDEMESMREGIAHQVKDIEKERLSLLRLNTVVLEHHDINSESFRLEIASIWKNSCFRYLLHLTRNEFVAEMTNGRDEAERNVPKMLKGIDAFAIKMQEMSTPINRVE